jgi:hypothetical protein
MKKDCPLILLISLAGSSGAIAQSAHDPWIGVVGGNLGASAQTGSQVDSTTVGASVFAEFYLARLVDEPDVPLGLLYFVQRTGNVTIAASVSDVSTSSPQGTPESQIYDGRASAEVYVWPDTGFYGSAELNQQTAGNLTQGFFELGVTHYFTRNIHLFADYGFDRGGSAEFGGAPSGLSTWASDWGFLGMNFLFAHDHLLLAPEMEIGWARGDYTNGNLAGLFYDASIDATFFIGRRFSVGAMPLRLSGRSLNPTTTGQSVVGDSYYTLTAAAHAQLYLTESFYINAAIDLGFKSQMFQDQPSTTSFLPFAAAGAGGRF